MVRKEKDLKWKIMGAYLADVRGSESHCSKGEE